MGRLWEKLDSYGNSDFYPYHMPGHKRNSYGNMPKEIAQLDITELDGFDNLHQPKEILLELQQEASKLYGAEESFYLVNGSTCGVLSAISAALPDGGHILMVRNSHKSAYHAAYLKNLTISYLYPPYLEEYNIYDAITPKQVEDALKEEPNIKAVFIVSPTYEGRIADIKEIVNVVHERGIPLIVDEAHGAHLGLAKEFPPNSCQQGADLVIHSVHKTLPAMTQTALLHVNGNMINRSSLKRFLHIYQSSSPSYVLMASIDNALQEITARGEQMFADLRKNYLQLLKNLQVCKNLKFVTFEEGKQDIGKLVISSKDKSLCGQQIYDMLLREYHLQLEMAASSFCLAMFTVGDEKIAFERLEKALIDIDRILDNHPTQNGKKGKAFTEVGQCEKSRPLPLKLAWDMDTMEVPLEQAVGKRVGEFVNLYPPGVPLLVPGEVLEQRHCEQLTEYRKQGLTVQGVGAEAPYYIKVLRAERS